MRIGAVYPQIELGGDPEAVRTIGRGIEALGFDHLLAYDHVLGAVHEDRDPPLTGPYTEHDPFHDPLVLFAYLAGMTERLEFVTGVLISPQRQTALIARQSADLALLSGGRFRLGVGIGWNYVEYEALGQDFKTRGAREEEQIELLRRLWTEPVVDFHGRFDTVARASTLPMPNEPIEIWLGGFGDIALDRAARVGDGFIFGGSTEHITSGMTKLRERLDTHGRDAATFGFEAAILTKKGAADQADKMRSWEALGGTHASVVSMSLGFETAEAHLDYFAQVAAELGLTPR